MSVVGLWMILETCLGFTLSRLGGSRSMWRVRTPTCVRHQRLCANGLVAERDQTSRRIVRESVRLLCKATPCFSVGSPWICVWPSFSQDSQLGVRHTGCMSIAQCSAPLQEDGRASDEKTRPQAQERSHSLGRAPGPGQAALNQPRTH